MRIRELDGLRGIAVLMVISEHYMSWLPQVGSRYGWLGVDLFFILSGFLITGILIDLRDKEHYFSVFYARRALRIFPPYYLALLIYFVFSVAVHKPGKPSIWLCYLFYYSSLYPGQPSQLVVGYATVPIPVLLGLVVLWSLSVEEIYYILWAPVVRFTSKRGFVAILLAMFVVAPLLRWHFHNVLYPETYAFYCRMDGLAYGSAVALLIHERRLNPGKWLPLDKLFDWLAVAVLLAGTAFWMATGGNRTNVLVTTAGLVFADLGFALLAHAIIRRAGGGQLWIRALRARWLRSVGMVSYSLYLFHYPLRYMSEYWVSRLGLSRHADITASVLLGLVLSFGVAYGLWYGMESRILRWKDRRVPSPAHPGR
jgi:peptidoglycan/LPS O-acetylase OafA/YrhL